MKNKGILYLITSIIVTLVGVIYYGYSKTPDSTELTSSTINALSNEEVTKGAVISITPDTHDLGTVIYGDVPERAFLITNEGSEPLEILRLSTSCGCTKATMAEEDKIIDPGKSVSMSVTFDPAVHKDATDLGELTRIIYIKTNDPKNPEVEVTITANVIKTD